MLPPDARVMPNVNNTEGLETPGAFAPVNPRLVQQEVEAALRDGGNHRSVAKGVHRGHYLARVQTCGQSAIDPLHVCP